VAERGLTGGGCLMGAVHFTSAVNRGAPHLNSGCSAVGDNMNR